MFYRSLTDEQTVRVRRARPVIALALVAFAAGAIVGANSGTSASNALAARFVAAWARSDYAAMYEDVDAATKRSLTADAFAAAYAEAMRTATATSLHVRGKARTASGGLISVPVSVRTRLFGTLA
ncbi:MAG TPA: NTF2-like N-terminal transpeptidase domain-containing protein, partial [Solirubrobacteraceae bacterium]